MTKKCYGDENVVINSAAVDELGSMVIDLPPGKFEDVSAVDLERNIEDIKNGMKKDRKKKRRRSKQAVMKRLGEKVNHH